MGEDAWNFVGHPVGREELDLITTILRQHARLSREELAATVCELLGWTRASGRLKARECREFLERLETAGVVTLPAKRIGRPVGARTAVPVNLRGDIHAAVTGTVRDVAPLHIVRITTADDRLLFRELVGRHHYLGHAVPVRGPRALSGVCRVTAAAGRRLCAVFECGVADGESRCLDWVG